mgnify:CR=1 FL=1
MTIIYVVSTTHQKSDHLKPFGSVDTLINIEELNYEFPTAFIFLTFYLRNSEPIISRQVLNNDTHYSIWQTDEQLEKNVYGLSNTIIQVESFALRQRIQMTFKELFHRYRNESLLFANRIPKILQ